VKLTLILMNIAAAAFVIWAGRVVCDFHKAKVVKTYIDLHVALTLGDSVGPKHPFDPNEILRITNDGAVYKLIQIFTYAAAAFFMLNAAAFFGFWKKKMAASPPPRS
jgi:hypothetical protein